MGAVPREFIEEVIKPMKCPFLENFKQVEQTTYYLNNDGVVESCQAILTEIGHSPIVYNMSMPDGLTADAR